MIRHLVSLLAACATLSAGAAIELPDIMSSNMVLQQNSDAKLWGWSTPGSVVTVTTAWNGKDYKATAGKDGRWDVAVATPAASFDPTSIRISGDGSNITLDNVLIGEVWFCSGQSNMEMPLRGFWTQPVENSHRAIAYSGKYPGIRVATVPKLASYEVQDRAPGVWKESNPDNAGEFSALAYFFAQSLTDILDVPVGIINCSYGGSKVEGWIPKWKLDEYDEWDVEKEKTIADSLLQEYERINVMYNAMLHPLIGYTVRGFLWNQGESNVGRHATYPQHQADMVKIWRDEWGQGELPFYFVEIPGWNYGDPQGTWAAIFRESQHRAADITPNSEFVSTVDLMYPYELEDIHGSRKQEIGERLAFMAANKTYGIKGISADYPRFKSMDVDGNKAILHFTNADDGFTPNDVLEGFEVAGPDKVFYPAQATEDPMTRNIVVTSDKVSDIKSVRYCFRNWAIGSVYNIRWLPLVPFRTDDWDN